MKTAFAVSTLLCLASGLASGASYIYRSGNQFPGSCGASGLFLESNGDCTTTWASNSVPSDTAKTDMDNNWSHAQTFNSSVTVNQQMIVGGNSLGLILRDQNFTEARWYMEPGGATLDFDSPAGSVADLWFKMDAMTLHFGSGYDVGFHRTGPATMEINNGTSGQLGKLSLGQVAVSTVTVSGGGAPPNSQALCFLAGQLGHCTTVVGAGGGCTCAAP